jgi:hypothetical protein
MFSQTDNTQSRRRVLRSTSAAGAQLGSVSNIRDARSLGTERALQPRTRKSSRNGASIAVWCATLFFLSGVPLLALHALAEISERLLELSSHAARAVSHPE